MTRQCFALGSHCSFGFAKHYCNRCCNATCCELLRAMWSHLETQLGGLKIPVPSPTQLLAGLRSLAGMLLEGSRPMGIAPMSPGPE